MHPGMNEAEQTTQAYTVASVTNLDLWRALDMEANAVRMRGADNRGALLPVPSSVVRISLGVVSRGTGRGGAKCVLSKCWASI